MAIQRELAGETAEGVKLYRTFSDEGRKILQNETGIVFDDAVDIENAGFTTQKFLRSNNEQTERTQRAASQSGEPAA